LSWQICSPRSILRFSHFLSFRTCGLGIKTGRAFRRILNPSGCFLLNRFGPTHYVMRWGSSMRKSPARYKIRDFHHYAI
jgi:hypothetical protein